MSHDSVDRLVYMANQIESFFKTTGHDKAILGIADHIAKFWDPRMRKRIYAHLDAGGKGLHPLTREALETLRAKDPITKEASNGNVVDQPRRAEPSGH
ncbi:MAG TPA: formate dehydrogenase subunit delta [Methylovirgula sp.]|jgi:formate dehydrogenase subunit delta